jgi:hypothetical protein
MALRKHKDSVEGIKRLDVLVAALDTLLETNSVSEMRERLERDLWPLSSTHHPDATATRDELSAAS